MLQMLDRPGFLIVGLIAILLFGAKRLPEAARSLGRSARILKAETAGLREDDPKKDETVHRVTTIPSES
ncbi:MAG: twin-arginine translocation protein TatA/E family subunit [Frankiales bacterium]|nr:twin-arginine translocation protein TatA/E family subunit [Frankiales bacterium]